VSAEIQFIHVVTSSHPGLHEVENLAKLVDRFQNTLGTNRPRVERCVSKAQDLGVTQALADLPGRGRRPEMTAAARAWVVALACQKPNDWGYSQETVGHPIAG
jgi:hypothetical protein